MFNDNSFSYLASFSLWTFGHQWAKEKRCGDKAKPESARCKGQ